jgi:hypothetical protein
MTTHAELIAAHAAACEAVRNASNLRELLYASRTECNAYLNALWQGVRTIERFDYDNETPVFVANRVPADTCEVWSWDETHMIIGAAVDVWRIVPRDDQ